MPGDRTESNYDTDDDRTDEYGTGYDDRTDEYGTGYDDRAADQYDDRTDYDTRYGDSTDDDGTLLDEGLIALLLLGGIALFLFPEPATSGLGLLLIATGVVLWLADWAM